VLGDCCADYQASCAGDAPAAPPDWIDRLIETAAKWGDKHPGEKPTLRDLLVALRDRLWTEGAMDATDETLLKKFFGVESLDVPIPQVGEKIESRLRLYCGVLVKAPQFMLTGLPDPAKEIPPPKLVVSGDGYRDLCEQLAPKIKEETGRAVSCAEASLAVAPAR
jgi:hypothetical protein